MQQALSLLPQEVKNTGVTVESGTTEELGILTLRSASGKLTHDQVADYVFGVVNPAILRVAGVGKSVVKDDKIAVFKLERSKGDYAVACRKSLDYP